MTSALDQLYSREPISMVNGIPVFSERDGYIKNYEKIAADHVSQITESHENPFMEEELWVSLEQSTREYIKKHVVKGSRILDVGVGLGRLLEPLTEYQRYGVDISADYLSIAKSRGIEVALSKIEELPYSPGFFDAIVVCDVLEHVFDLNYCCEKILNCLRPGGVLIVRVPYREDLEVYLSKDLPYEFIHMRNFDEASLRLLFQKILGMNYIESATTTPYLQGTPRLKLRLLPENVKKRLLNLANIYPELQILQSVLDVSSEDFQAWIYMLRDEHREIFDKVASELIMGIDFNIVFTKPFDEIEVQELVDRSQGSHEVELCAASMSRLLSATGNEVGGLRQRMEDKSQEIIALNTQLETLNTQVETLNTQVETLNTQVETLNTQVETLNNDVRASLLFRISAFADRAIKRFG
jgi:SAM-dependent methyltransferase/outer membrane murein-binding lipoprotein Lpp